MQVSAILPATVAPRDFYSALAVFLAVIVQVP